VRAAGRSAVRKIAGPRAGEVTFLPARETTIVKATDLGGVQVLKHEDLYMLTDGFGDIHCPQDGRRFILAAVTGRAGGCRYAFQSVEHMAANATSESNVKRVGKPLCGMAVEFQIVPEQFLQPGVQIVAQLRQPRTAGFQVRRCQFAGSAERNVEQYVFGSGTSPRFMACPVDQRFKHHSLSNVERANALGRI